MTPPPPRSFVLKPPIIKSNNASMQTPIFQTNPRLRALLLILIFTFAVSGITLAVLAQIQAYGREQVYLATEAALPVHRVSTSVPSPSNGEGLGEVDIKGWKTYTNSEYGFEFKYPAGAAVGGNKQSLNLGTAQSPVYGVEIMGAALVELSKGENKKTAQGIFNQMLSYLALPKEAYETGEMSPPVCKLQEINNPSLSVQAIYCEGEGGPAYYAYISGGKNDFFLDGYPARGLDIVSLNKVLSTFKFTK